MTTKAHSLLTGADLHEPKGIESATANQVYISNGSGSGTWQNTASTIGVSQFSTGDLKPTFKTVADSSWIMCDDGTIGSAASAATNRANADTATLFALLWNNFANTEAPVSGSRGASAAADFAANKTIRLPLVLGRVYGVAGAGAGLTSRVLGKTVGVETYTLVITDLPASGYTFTGSPTAISVGSGMGVGNGQAASGTGNLFGSTVTSQTYSGTATPLGTVTVSGGSQPHSIVQPTVFLNMMVKL